MRCNGRWAPRVGATSAWVALVVAAGSVVGITPTTGHAAASQPGPSVLSFTIRRGGGGALIAWRSGSEAGALGYNVYRRVGATRARMNATLIPAVGGSSGHVYRVLDRETLTAARYWLQTVSASGTRAWVGPASRG